MNAKTDRVKFINIADGEAERKFAVYKFDAQTGFYISLLLSSKFLPILDSFEMGSMIISAFKNNNEEDNDGLTEKALSSFSFEKISKALGGISKNDLKEIVTAALMNCHEILPAGQTPVLNENGTYGVDGIEFDYILTMRLVAEAIILSAGSFFDVNRLVSILKPVADSFMQNA
jgi:hypothetical protein